jgi:hypothetical protein
LADESNNANWLPAVAVALFTRHLSIQAALATVRQIISTDPTNESPSSAATAATAVFALRQQLGASYAATLSQVLAADPVDRRPLLAPRIRALQEYGTGSPARTVDASRCATAKGQLSKADLSFDVTATTILLGNENCSGLGPGLAAAYCEAMQHVGLGGVDQDRILDLISLDPTTQVSITRCLSTSVEGGLKRQVTVDKVQVELQRVGSVIWVIAANGRAEPTQRQSSLTEVALDEIRDRGRTTFPADTAITPIEPLIMARATNGLGLTHFKLARTRPDTYGALINYRRPQCAQHRSTPIRVDAVEAASPVEEQIQSIASKMPRCGVPVVTTTTTDPDAHVYVQFAARAAGCMTGGVPGRVDRAPTPVGRSLFGREPFTVTLRALSKLAPGQFCQRAVPPLKEPTS